MMSLYSGAMFSDSLRKTSRISNHLTKPSNAPTRSPKRLSPSSKLSRREDMNRRYASVKLYLRQQ